MTDNSPIDFSSAESFCKTVPAPVTDFYKEYHLKEKEFSPAEIYDTIQRNGFENIDFSKENANGKKGAAILFAVVLEGMIAEALYNAIQDGKTAIPREIYQLQQRLGQLYDAIGVILVKFHPNDQESVDNAGKDMLQAAESGIGQSSARRYVAAIHDALKIHFQIGRS